ncbi:phosphoribosyl-ATP diphosphatase [Vallitalea okinawensis]|uniref:phosphoribosyl-ATP diphosphatase n=1 Tax=Vallitalea okinawensis TaxID=2078660 RepID=UPI000CFB9FA9|nr:phosphoribosyl-ATP diphosphatase [Vallitalea okinawensis]
MKDVLSDLMKVVNDRKENPKEGSYTNYLLDTGIDKILKKVGEESAEVIIASKNNESSEVVYEVADLMYHITVLLVELGIDWNDIDKELSKRR